VGSYEGPTAEDDFEEPHEYAAGHNEGNHNGYKLSPLTEGVPESREDVARE